MPKWHKQGRVFYLDEAPNRSTHTQVPTILVKDNIIRVYYACRNNGKSFPTFVDLDRNTFKVVRSHEKPIMELGKPGMFDADGVMPSCVIENNGEIWLYYIGWSELKNTARYQNEIGLAVSKDGGESFERMFRGPIIGRSSTEPGLAVMPYILKDKVWHCWYQSLTSWRLIDEQYEPIYVIKYAHSVDGINWKRHADQCIQSNYPLEAFSRPSVILAGKVFHMWFCYRHSEDYRDGMGAYRIGYAQSLDGIRFKRMDSLAGIDVGVDGEWDSNQICYPQVVKIDGRLLMFYNGSGFGKTGIGLAEYGD